MSIVRMVVVLSGLFLLAGCGKAALGETCGESSECEVGLSCLQQNAYDFASEVCVPGEMYCSVPCDSDADCVSKVGTGHICVGTGGGLTDCTPGLCFVGSVE